MGLRDEGALDAALARPRHRWAYEPDTGLSALAAAYCFGIVQGHPFVDGNKRVGLVVMVAFLVSESPGARRPPMPRWCRGSWRSRRAR